MAGYVITTRNFEFAVSLPDGGFERFNIPESCLWRIANGDINIDDLKGNWRKVASIIVKEWMESQPQIIKKD